MLIPDPPWIYGNKREFRKDGGKTKTGIGAVTRYSNGCMTPERLESLADLIDQVVTADAYCLMWATCPYLPMALEVLESWGFEFKTVPYVWVKTYKGSTRPFCGIGAYTASNIEPVLLGTRGENWHSNVGYMPGQVIESNFWDEEAFFAAHPRDQNDKIIHSRKPPEFWLRVNRWLPRADKLELFATEPPDQSIPNNDRICLGHELSGRDIAVDLAILASQIRQTEEAEKPKIQFASSQYMPQKFTPNP